MHVLDLRHRPELFETHDPTDSGLFVSPDRRSEQGSAGMSVTILFTAAFPLDRGIFERVAEGSPFQLHDES